MNNEGTWGKSTGGLSTCFVCFISTVIQATFTDLFHDVTTTAFYKIHTTNKLRQVSFFVHNLRQRLTTAAASLNVCWFFIFTIGQTYTNRTPTLTFLSSIRTLFAFPFSLSEINRVAADCQGISPFISTLNRFRLLLSKIKRQQLSDVPTYMILNQFTSSNPKREQNVTNFTYNGYN